MGGEPIMAGRQGTERLDRMAPAAALRFLAAECRGEYALRAPELVWGLQHGSPVVAGEAAQCLIDLGSPGLRAVWTAYDAPGWTDEQRGRMEAFLVRNGDWLFERLFEEYTATPRPETVARRARLWAHPALKDRLLAHLEDDADVWLGRQSRAILAALGETPQR